MVSPAGRGPAANAGRGAEPAGACRRRTKNWRGCWPHYRCGAAPPMHACCGGAAPSRCPGLPQNACSHNQIFLFMRRRIASRSQCAVSLGCVLCCPGVISMLLDRSTCVHAHAHAASVHVNGRLCLPARACACAIALWPRPALAPTHVTHCASTRSRQPPSLVSQRRRRFGNPQRRSQEEGADHGCRGAAHRAPRGRGGRSSRRDVAAGHQLRQGVRVAGEAGL